MNLNIYNIKTLAVKYRARDSKQEISLIELLHDNEMELLTFLGDVEMSGEVIYYVKYSDGEKPVVTHDKSEPDLSEGTFRLFDFVQRWLTIYEWRDSKEFETRREFLKFDSLYEGLRFLAGPEKWSYYANFSVRSLKNGWVQIRKDWTSMRFFSSRLIDPTNDASRNHSLMTNRFYQRTLVT